MGAPTSNDWRMSIAAPPCRAARSPPAATRWKHPALSWIHSVADRIHRGPCRATHGDCHDRACAFRRPTPHSWCIATRDALLAVADLADELDMDISVQDHLLADSSVSPCGHAHPATGEDRTVFEAHTTLAFLAARTERSRLIAGVYVLPFRQPVWLAKETSSLDALSQGRLIVGVGVAARWTRARTSRRMARSPCASSTPSPSMATAAG
ncbi:MAG: LLM class flavin-dependent oxidoreductase [Chloroflexota bacterium]